MILELNFKSSLVNVHVDTRPTRCCGPRNKKIPISGNKGFSMPFKEIWKFTFSSFGGSRFQKFAWMLVESCIKCDFHFLFPTGIRSNSELSWVYIACTGIDVDPGQDTTGFRIWLPEARTRRYRSAVSNTWQKYQRNLVFCLTLFLTICCRNSRSIFLHAHWYVF